MYYSILQPTVYAEKYCFVTTKEVPATYTYIVLYIYIIIHSEKKIPLSRDLQIV